MQSQPRARVSTFEVVIVLFVEAHAVVDSFTCTCLAGGFRRNPVLCTLAQSQDWDHCDRGSFVQCLNIHGRTLQLSDLQICSACWTVNASKEQST